MLFRAICDDVFIRKQFIYGVEVWLVDLWPTNLKPLHYSLYTTCIYWLPCCKDGDLDSGSETSVKHLNGFLISDHTHSLVLFLMWYWVFSAVFVGSMSPLCVLQLDDPPQRFNTSVLKNTTNPAWDQPFILWVLPYSSAEMVCVCLFKLWIKTTNSCYILLSLCQWTERTLKGAQY